MSPRGKLGYPTQHQWNNGSSRALEIDLERQNTTIWSSQLGHGKDYDLPPGVTKLERPVTSSHALLRKPQAQVEGIKLI